jgi:hypothetical protein
VTAVCKILYEIRTWYPRRNIATQIVDLKNRAQHIGEHRTRYGVRDPQPRKKSNLGGGATRYLAAENQDITRQLVRAQQPVGVKVLCACKRLQPLQRWHPLRPGAAPQQVLYSRVAQFSVKSTSIQSLRGSSDGYANPTNRSVRDMPLQIESRRELLQRSGRSPDGISSVILVEKDRCLAISFLQEWLNATTDCSMTRCSSYNYSCRSFIKSKVVIRIMEYLNLFEIHGLN